ncbi:MAG: tRNA preQ1(34) S-adenosylmethionine ribosyltransferase-isomerase QueA [bacterium]|nr:tRNA preQ1(34) S-adenosylmethionine ribosyltransferase-isomerase QueA [bacterium]
MKLSDFDYALAPEIIAQRPLGERDASRLLVLERTSGRITHTGFLDLPRLLEPGDLLALNDTRVFPARIFGRKAPTGGRVELLLLEDLGQERWRALIKPYGRIRAPQRLAFADGMEAVVEEMLGDGQVVVRLFGRGPLPAWLEAHGRTPLPPYIKRRADDLVEEKEDRERYQTLFAAKRGAVAAPTAGLHFTERVFEGLADRGIERVAITLHVGLGTFQPVGTERLEDHVMEAERYEVGGEAAQAVRRAAAEGRRVIAVGSTALRALESAAAAGGEIRAEGVKGKTALYIYPGYKFKIVGGLLTNFHLPRSTLLLLVSAFAGKDHLLAAYREAIARRYRFYSYGDAMLIL